MEVPAQPMETVEKEWANLCHSSCQDLWFSSSLKKEAEKKELEVTNGVSLDGAM